MIFSIITVTLNNLKALEKTINTTLNQSTANFEVIVIDGNSTDGTKNYLGSINDSRVRYISEPDSGLYDAMNKGINIANGDYMIFMNAGDTFANENVLDMLIDTIGFAEIDLIYGDAIEESEDGNTTFYKKARSHNYSWYGMFTHHQSMIYNSKNIKWNNLKYDNNLTIAADYQFTLQFLTHCKAIVQVKYPICIFKQGGASSGWRNGIKQQWVIRRNVLKYGILRCSIIYLTLIFVIFIRKYLNPIYNFIRFS